MRKVDVNLGGGLFLAAMLVGCVTSADPGTGEECSDGRCDEGSYGSDGWGHQLLEARELEECARNLLPKLVDTGAMTDGQRAGAIAALVTHLARSWWSLTFALNDKEFPDFMVLSPAASCGSHAVIDACQAYARVSSFGGNWVQYAYSLQSEYQWTCPNGYQCVEKEGTILDVGGEGLPITSAYCGPDPLACDGLACDLDEAYKCLDISATCDGRKDCSDSTDETNCPCEVDRDCPQGLKCTWIEFDDSLSCQLP